jgi:hypothetical protein
MRNEHARDRRAIAKSIADSAEAILALINSKPSTPTREEVEAVLARAFPAASTAATLPAMSPARAALWREWRERIEAHMREFAPALLMTNKVGNGSDAVFTLDDDWITTEILGVVVPTVGGPRHG